MDALLYLGAALVILLLLAKWFLRRSLRWATYAHQQISPSETYFRAVEHVLEAQGRASELLKIETENAKFKSARFVLMYSAFDTHTSVDHMAYLLMTAMDTYRDSPPDALFMLQEWKRMATSTNWADQNSWKV